MEFAILLSVRRLDLWVGVVVYKSFVINTISVHITVLRLP